MHQKGQDQSATVPLGTSGMSLVPWPCCQSWDCSFRGGQGDDPQLPRDLHGFLHGLFAIMFFQCFFKTIFLRFEIQIDSQLASPGSSQDSNGCQNGAKMHPKMGAIAPPRIKMPIVSKTYYLLCFSYIWWCPKPSKIGFCRPNSRSSCSAHLLATRESSKSVWGAIFKP